jgi:hypothetical protein
MAAKPIQFVFRINMDAADKFLRLCEQAGRTPSEVLRRFVEQAQLVPSLDVGIPAGVAEGDTHGGDEAA